MKWFTMIKHRKMCENPGCYNRMSPTAKSKGKKICATCVRRSGKGRMRVNKE